jgi:type VI secretion system (T6SS) VasI/EvfG family protein
MLDSCFQLARAADATCAGLKGSVAERLDCRQKANMAQLECLERVFPGRSAGPVPPELPTVSASPEVPAGSVSAARPPGAVAKGGPASSPKMPPAATPAETSTATIPPEITTGFASPGGPARRVDVPATPQDTNWIVSETTSPVDYSPLTTAEIRSTTGLQDAPNTLVIRCLGPRTEVLLRTQGTWSASRSSKVQVEYQIDDDAPVKSQWIASVDGKTVSYGNDAVGFLQSLPEGARLKINVPDRAGPGHEATFQLAGLDAVRKRIAAPCKWTIAADKISSGNR